MTSTLDLSGRNIYDVVEVYGCLAVEQLLGEIRDKNVDKQQYTEDDD